MAFQDKYNSVMFEHDPLYYGTVDATPLWICLLNDAWHWGLPDAARKSTAITRPITIDC